MRFVGFIGPSYKLASVNVDCQRCINLYPEINEIGTGKEREVAALVSTPGLLLLNTIGAGPFRGAYVTSMGLFFVVSGNTVYSVNSTWVATPIGTLTTNIGSVSMADSEFRLAIVDGSTSGYFYKFSDLTWSSIPFPTDIDFIAFAGCDQVTYQDGYFVYNNSGANQFFWSGPAGSTVADDSTIDPLDFNSADESPDPLIGHLSDHRNLWLFGTKTTQIFYNAGDPNDVFQQIQGAFVEHGLAARFSIAKMNNTVFWLGADDKGNGMVFQASGYQPQRISTHAVEQAIQSYANISDAVAFTYQQNGHHFYVLNFTSANTTWVYDTTTNLWHERVYTSNGSFQRHRASCHAFVFGKHVVGDYQNGNLYELSTTTYTDNGAVITRRRTSPHISNSLVRLFYNTFQLDIEAGVGLDGVAQGTDPQVMLRWSNDGGHTWSNEHWRSIGKIGHTRHRVRWLKLGTARDRVFEVTVTDPVKVTLLGVEMDIERGAS